MSVSFLNQVHLLEGVMKNCSSTDLTISEQICLARKRLDRRAIVAMRDNHNNLPVHQQEVMFGWLLEELQHIQMEHNNVQSTMVGWREDDTENIWEYYNVRRDDLLISDINQKQDQQWFICSLGLDNKVTTETIKQQLENKFVES